MRNSVVWIWACVGALLPAAALAEDPGVGAGAYCDFVEGEADAESALLMAPELFGRVGVVNPGDVLDEGTAAVTREPLPRVTLGVSWDVARMLSGLGVQRRARAECRRFRALASLESALVLGRNVAEAAALEARERVLREALTVVEPGLVELRKAMADQDATLDELQAYELRLDDIRQTLRETALERKRLEGLPQPPEVPLTELVAELQAADDEVEGLSADLRRTSTWELGVRGGYDKIIGSEALPVFGMVTFSWNTGALWQGAANARARTGRSGWVAADVTGAAHRARQLLRELELLHASARTRLDEVNALEADLGNQLATVERLQTRAVRRFRDLLRFEHTRLKAEKAYLDQRVERLEKFLDRSKSP
jgi:hypothetical protein